MAPKSSFILAALCAASAITTSVATPAGPLFTNQAANEISELSFEQWQQVEDALGKVQEEFESTIDEDSIHALYHAVEEKEDVERVMGHKCDHHMDQVAHMNAKPFWDQMNSGVDIIEEELSEKISEAEQEFEELSDKLVEEFSEFAEDIKESFGSLTDSILGISDEIIHNIKYTAEETLKSIEHPIDESYATYDHLSHIGGNIIQDAWKGIEALGLEVMENVDGWSKIVRMAAFPEYQLRFKSPKICDPDVNQISGYLDIGEDKHFFFWFFEAREDPEDAPVVLWLNGGPGCSSMTGLLMELGPCSVNKKGTKDVYNEYSWSRRTNMIFLDQPTNVGFSYGEGVSNTVAAGKDVYALLNLFFSQFSKYADNDFHIAGESYGGHYVPQFALEIHQHNTGAATKFIAEPDTNAVKKINLKTILIGNGLTDPLNQYDSYADMACENDYGPVLSKSQCDQMRAAMPRCKQLIESCYKSGSVFACVPASIYCNRVTLQPYQETGRNVYDVRDECEDKENLCYPIIGSIQKYLNQPHVQKELGVEVDEYRSCNMNININFQFAGDWMKGIFVEAVRDLLEDGIEVLVYAGDADYICNWMGNENWTRQLEWSGQRKFVSAPFNNWTVIDDGSMGGKSTKGHKVLAGRVRSAGNGLTFLKLHSGGHMVPWDQPHSSREAYEAWIFGDYSRGF